ncbi:MAG: tetratricopeptide repeat protein, partial [bacterium]
MDTSIHYWKEKFIIAVSLVVFNFLIIVKLFDFISNSTLLFVGQQINSIFLFFIYVFFTVFIPGIIIGLGIFICILVYYIFVRSIWLFDAEENNIIGERANNIYLFSFNVLSKILMFLVLFSVSNVVLFIILGGEIQPNNLTYFAAFLMANLLFVESENVLAKRLNLPAIFPNINISFKYFVKNILLIIIISLILVAGVQFIGGIANRLNLKIQAKPENGVCVDPLVKMEVTVKGITNTGRKNSVPIYLDRMNRLYQKAKREFASGNYLITIGLLQKELNVSSNFFVSVYSDRMHPWVSKLLSDKISNNILFIKNSLPAPLADVGYPASANKDKFNEYFLIPLAINEELKINVWKNSRGAYSHVFRESELLDISQAHINKKIGDCFLLLGNYGSAKDYYGHALEKNGYCIEAKNNLGYIYMKENSFIKAECEYRDILDISPNYALAKINLGNLYLNNGRVEQALNVLRTIDLKDDFPRKIKIFYYQTMADVFYKKREFKEAEKIY